MCGNRKLINGAMLSTSNSYKKYKRSGGNEELETLSTFDLYGEADKTGMGNLPVFLCPARPVSRPLLSDLHSGEGFPALSPRSLISNVWQRSAQRPLSITDATLTKRENLQNFAGTVCPVNKTIQPFKPW